MNRKKYIFTVAKVVFAVTVLAWLFHKVNIGLVWSSVKNANRIPILAGIILTWLTVLIAGFRWHRLLAAFGIHMPFWTLACITQIGGFFTMFLPGPIGDDLTRMLYISRLAKGRVGEACTTVVVDRCIGLTSILLLGVVWIPRQWGLLTRSSETYWLAVGISAAGAVALTGSVLFLLFDGLFMQRIVDKILKCLPPSKTGNELSLISRQIFTHKTVIFEVMLAAIGTQFLLCMIFYLAGESVGIHYPLTLWLGFVPIVLAANAVPITLGGLGVREFLLVLFLGVLAHVEKEQALAASFIAFSMVLVVCLCGGIIYIFYRPAEKDATAVLR